ncbi:secretory Phospholipase A2 [Carabus blaptoides fortunei]
MLIIYTISLMLIQNYCDAFNILDVIHIPEIKLIYPGTKWCGAGNISKDKYDLGSDLPTDICCRAHDMCDDVIEAGQSKHGLLNQSPFTRLHCNCDQKFYRCLKNITVGSAQIIGDIYFDILGSPCYKKQYPVLKCINHDSIYKNRCIEYKFNVSSTKSWTWFDVPHF